jgi:hypothetical protein
MVKWEKEKGKRVPPDTQEVKQEAQNEVLTPGVFISSRPSLGVRI